MTSARTTIKVLSYNMHKGFTYGNRRFVLKHMKDAIESIHPDMVFLQEVLGHHREHQRRHAEWPAASQFEYLADRLWPHFAYGKNAVYQSGHHGNAILSKYPFSFWENTDISTNWVEKRGLLHGVIEVPHHRKPLHTICLHLGLFETERKAQVIRVCHYIRELVPDDCPLIISGDFNDWRVKVSRMFHDELGMDEIFEKLHGSPPATFPSWMPFLKLDRMYYRGISPVSALCLTGSPWNELSDHIALLGEFEV